MSLLPQVAKKTFGRLRDVLLFDMETAEDTYPNAH